MAGEIEALLASLGASGDLNAYLTAAGVFILALLVLRVFKFLILRRLKGLSKYTKTDFDDVLIEAVDAIHWPFYVVFSLFLGAQFAPIGTVLGTAIYYLLLIAAVYYAVAVLSRLIEYWIEKMVDKRRAEAEDADPSQLYLIQRVVKVALYVVAVTLLLSNLGYDVSTLIAGVGVAGIVLGFALQNVLADLFASFAIYFDRPFRVGHYIVIGDDSGTVKKIGLKSTRIKTLRGEELVVSNKELTNTRIHNFKSMKKRRITFSFGVLYETPVAKVKKVPDLVKNVVAKSKQAEVDRIHFKEFGDFSLNFDVVYYMTVPDYASYMNTQQEINLGIMEAFEKEGIEFAYPTQKVFVEKGT